MTLLETALQCAARGWFVFPCKPRDKYPITPNGWHDASREEAKIRAWWTKTPNANVGIACGMSGLAVLDIDTGLISFADFASLCAAMSLPDSYIVRSGRRPGFGIQVYFAGAIPDVHGWNAHGCTGDIKSLGGYVLAAGSIHPSGETYQDISEYLQLHTTPESVRSLKSPNTGTGKNLEPVIGGRHAYLTSVAGKMRNAGLGVEAMEVALLQHNADVCKPPLSDADVTHIAKSVGRYDVPERTPEVTIGDPDNEIPESVSDDDDSNDLDIETEGRPVYPVDAWGGTAYAEFAALCTTDNEVPPKFFIEAIRTATGAIVGDRLRCSMASVNPRAFTVFIAPPQKGKGTAIDRILELFGERWDSLTRTEEALLFHHPTCLWRPRGVGAQILNPASAPGLMVSLAPMQKKKADAPSVDWKPMPRLITIMEEIRGLFSNLTLESTGAGLEGVLCELFDRTSYSATATAKRNAQSGEAMLSILGGITPEEWDKIFSQTSSAGSGFLSRLNIIGTEGLFPRAPGIEPPDFSEFRRSFFPRIQALEEKPMLIRPTPAAKMLIGEWLSTLDLSISARINLHAWRAALHIAWLHGAEWITEEHIRRGVDIAKYQLAMRTFYAAAEGDSRQARCEGAIRKAIRRGPQTLWQLKRATNYQRHGIDFWNKCLKALIGAGEIRKSEKNGKVLFIPLKTKG